MNKIIKCRICNNPNLVSILKLGKFSLTGIFPKEKNQNITRGNLELVKCHDEENSSCGLVQLSENFDLNEMYGDNYGYRSALNNSMVDHLKSIISDITKHISLKKGDLIIDIGSNDGTTLSFYDQNIYDLVGIDPTAYRFKQYYNENIKIVSDFFSKDIIEKNNYFNRAKIITSFAMFYDLEDPIEFATTISKTLDEKEGIWVFEQSYLPSMLNQMAYDTICHEHLEYYSLKQIEWICKKSNLKIIDVELTNTNGGSFLVKCAHINSNLDANNQKIQSVIKREQALGINDLEIYEVFKKNIESLKNDLIKLIKKINNNGHKVYGVGASTKGNVILQYCNFSSQDIEYICEVNSDKFGSFTPGTNIPIVDEKEINIGKDDYLIILPWHFKFFFLSSDHYKNKNLIFPLPKIEIIKT